MPRGHRTSSIVAAFSPPSRRRKPGSRATGALLQPWIPAFAGMTKEKRSRAESYAMPRSMLQGDEIFGELGHRHGLRRDLGHHGAAVEHHEAVGNLMHVGEVVLDIDAGPA